MITSAVEIKFPLTSLSKHPQLYPEGEYRPDRTLLKTMIWLSVRPNTRNHLAHFLVLWEFSILILFTVFIQHLALSQRRQEISISIKWDLKHPLAFSVCV